MLKKAFSVTATIDASRMPLSSIVFSASGAALNSVGATSGIMPKPIDTATMNTLPRRPS